jgi:hypothetical protein
MKNPSANGSLAIVTPKTSRCAAEAEILTLFAYRPETPRTDSDRTVCRPRRPPAVVRFGKHDKAVDGFAEQ